MKSQTIFSLSIFLFPLTMLAELHGFSSDVGRDGLNNLSFSIYALAASIVIASLIIAGAISKKSS